MFSISEITEKINKEISTIQYPSSPSNLYAPIRYILDIGGKRIRPLLMLMGYNIWKEDIDTIMPQALALETYHNFTLLHDDLMDKSEVRRGNPTVHIKWNDNSAVLSGDTMLILAYRMFGQNQAYQDFINATLGVCEGQQYDMEFETRNNVSEDEYMEMIRLKTSLLLGYALKIGATLAGAPKEDAEKLYDFGEKMGLAFQIQDDLLDVYGDSKLFKKRLGADIVDNKKTFLLINALNRANQNQRAELNKWINAKSFVPEEKIAAITSIYNELNIQGLASERIEKLFALSVESLNAVNVSEEHKKNLREFANNLLDRQF